MSWVSSGGDHDVCVGLAGAKDARHVQRRRRRSDVTLRCVRSVEHQMAQRMNNSVMAVIVEVNEIRHHVRNSRFARCVKSARRIPLLNRRLDVVLALSGRTHFLSKQSCDERRRRSLGIEARRFLIQWRLTVDETGEAIRAVLDFGVSGLLEQIHCCVTRDVCGAALSASRIFSSRGKEKSYTGFGVSVCTACDAAFPAGAPAATTLRTHSLTAMRTSGKVIILMSPSSRDCWVYHNSVGLGCRQCWRATEFTVYSALCEKAVIRIVRLV